MGARAPAASDDREADHLVAPAGQREATDRRGAARSREREDRGTLVPEEPLPAPRLGGVRGEHDDGGDRHEPEVRVMQRPPCDRKVACNERSDDRCDTDQRDVEEPLQLFQLPGTSARVHSRCTRFLP